MQFQSKHSCINDLVYNNYSMSPSWTSSDKITNERVARVGYNHFISNKGKWNNCFSKFSNRVLQPIFISTRSLRLVVYEFFSCSTNIPRGLSGYNP